MSTDDVETSANDMGGGDDLLSPMESTDSDDLKNRDGDEVVDPPEGWSGVTKFGMTADEQAELSPTDWVREQTERILEQGTTDGVEVLDRPIVLFTTTGAKSGKKRY